MLSYNFHKFPTSYDTAVELGMFRKGEVSPSKFYGTLLASLVRRGEAGEAIPHLSNAVTEGMSQFQWVRAGRPYCKVWPEMAWQFSRTSIKIPVKEFKPVMPILEIQLPRQSNPIQEEGCPALRTMLVLTSFDDLASVPDDEFEGASFVRRVAPNCFPARNKMVIWCYFGETVSSPGLPRATPRYCFLSVKFDGFEMIDQAYEAASARAAQEMERSQRGVGRDSPPNDYFPSPAFFERIMSLALCTNFFIAEKHELVAPEVAPRFKEQFARAKKHNDPKLAGQAVAKSKQLGFGGYLVGSEIEVPRPQVIRHETVDHEETGIHREISYSYIRSGHVRFQPYGPGRVHRRFRYMPPVRVRPDLAMVKKAAAFKITDRT